MALALKIGKCNLIGNYRENNEDSVDVKLLPDMTVCMVADGMADLAENPDHRRSPLVSLTAAGREALRVMWQREAELLDELPVESAVGRIQNAADVLRELRRLLEGVRPPAAKEEEP